LVVLQVKRSYARLGLSSREQSFSIKLAIENLMLHIKDDGLSIVAHVVALGFLIAAILMLKGMM
jgi:hypothetical protein